MSVSSASRYMAIIAIAASALTLGSLTATSEDNNSAADAAADWTVKSKALRGIDSSDAGQGADFYNYSEIIEFSEPGNSIIILSCRTSSLGKSLLTAGIQLDPDSNYEENPERILNVDRASGKLWIGKKGRQERWYWHTKSTKMTPIDAAVSRRIFNGAVRGDTFRLKTAREDVRMQLPPQNDVFKDFARACPEVNGGKVDMSVFENAADAGIIELEN